MSNAKILGLKGDGVADDTAALQKAVAERGSCLTLPPGTCRITQPIRVDLTRTGRFALSGDGGCARLLMDGPGPALWLVGGHEGTASPASLVDHVLNEERFPTISALEICGNHPEADGIRIEGLWEPTITQVYVHDCRHGIHVTGRNRNVIVADCHIHNNSGIGIFYDHLNLHQSNILGSHISYNNGGGIKVLESEIRNLQISGNDIEYNFDPDADESADVWIETLSSSVREGTIVGNTIQAMPSPGGANVRIRGLDAENPRRAGNWAISGNLISSQMINIHLQFVRGVAISGNSFFSGHERNIRIEDASCIALGANTLDRHPDYRAPGGGGIEIIRSSNCTISGSVVSESAPVNADGAIRLQNSKNISITGCQIASPQGNGIHVSRCANATVTSCVISADEGDSGLTHGVKIKDSTGILVQGNVVTDHSGQAVSAENSQVKE